MEQGEERRKGKKRAEQKEKGETMSNIRESKKSTINL
jgi:hypothetical protein